MRQCQEHCILASCPKPLRFYQADLFGYQVRLHVYERMSRDQTQIVAIVSDERDVIVELRVWSRQGRLKHREHGRSRSHDQAAWNQKIVD